MPLSDLSDSQIEFIQDKLALKTSPSLIVNEFKQVYDNQSLTYDHILDIKRLFSAEIKKKYKKEMADTSDVAVSHSRVRLEIIQKALELAWQYKGVGSYAVTDPITGLTTYKEKMDINHKAINDLIKLAQAEEFMAKKLELEKLSRGITAAAPKIDNPGTPVVQIYTGHEEEEEEEVKLLNGQ